MGALPLIQGDIRRFCASSLRQMAKIAKCSQDTALRDISELVDATSRQGSGSGRSTSYSLAL